MEISRKAHTSDSRIEQDAGVLRGEEFRSRDMLILRGARAATAFHERGLEAGDAIALLLRNDFAVFEASIAANLLGAHAVPINWHWKQDEVRFVIEDSRAKLLIAHSDLLAELHDAVPSDVSIAVVRTPHDITAAYGTDGQTTDHTREEILWELWAEHGEPWAEQRQTVTSAMMYTSGTTGRPKGVRHAPRNRDDPLTRRVRQATGSALGAERGMRTVIAGPMYHAAPRSYAMRALEMEGLVALQPKFDAEELLALVERHRIDHLYLVPTMFVRLLRLPREVKQRYDVSCLRHVVHAAAPCPPDVKRAMIDWWGPIIYEFYGGTETGIVTACSSLEWLAHPGTVGRPLDGAVVKVLDEDGKDLPPGTRGEVYARLPTLDFEYEGMPEERRAVERQGLITVGDVGYFDQDGYLYLCDRKRDMVVSAGVNIYPAEIEAVLAGMPGIRDCAVFGIPDEEFGESLAAAVALEQGVPVTADDVKSFVRIRLASYKVPKVVTFHDELPREDSGKLLKRKLRDPYWESAGRAI